MSKNQKTVVHDITLVRELDTIEVNNLVGAFELLHANQLIKIVDFAKHLQCSERTLRRKCQQYFDMSPITLLKNIRLNKAALLLNSGIKSGQVWHQVGFSSHSYFSDVFKSRYGVVPSEFK